MTNYNKRMFFWTGLRPEICAAIQRGKDYLTFNAYLKAGVEVETALCLDAEYNKAFKSAPKDKAQEKARKGKGKPRNDSLESRITRDAPQRSHCNFCSRGCAWGCGGHGHYPQGNGSGAQGSGAHWRPGNYKACSKPGHWAQDCRTNPPANAAALSGTTLSKPKLSGKEKA